MSVQLICTKLILDKGWNYYLNLRPWKWVLGRVLKMYRSPGEAWVVSWVGISVCRAKGLKIYTCLKTKPCNTAADSLGWHYCKVSWCTAVALKRQWPPRGWQGDIVGWRRGLIFQWKNGGHHYTFGGYVVQVTIKITTDKMKGSPDEQCMKDLCRSALWLNNLFHFLLHHFFFFCLFFGIDSFFLLEHGLTALFCPSVMI